MQWELEARIEGAVKNEIFNRRELSKMTKLKVVNAIVLSVLPYGCEAWALNKDQLIKVHINHVFIRIEGVS